MASWEKVVFGKYDNFIRRKSENISHNPCKTRDIMHILWNQPKYHIDAPVKHKENKSSAVHQCLSFSKDARWSLLPIFINER